MVAALYRRYRPESFSEMIGQSQVTEPLMTALRNGRVGHAYLFSGPRGCGKTTSARILARCLNCAEGPTDTPCNVCPSCIELSRDGGGSLDVVEIDAASHGGVDDARDLRERAVFAPARDRFKIFIIDEAHMVTSAGFNALLKIVEEPPPHVKFVFATTEPEKVIGTIRSRTHHYPFRLIAPGTLIDYVQSLCEAEGVQVEPGVLPLVVRAGGGSVRDTLSILDQLIAGSEGAFVTAERAAGLLGFTGSELLDEVVTAFGAHDAAAAFRATDRVVQTGQDPRRFVEDLLERLRDLIVVSATTVEGAAAVFRGVPQDQLSRMFEQAQQFGSGELSRVADVTSDTLDRMVGATAPRLQLELMIARALVALDELRAAAGMPAGVPAGVPVQFTQQAQQHAQRAQTQVSAQPQVSAQAPVPQQTPVPAQQAAQHAPVQPQAPAVDPISALAAARNAVTQAAPAQPAPTQPAPTQAPAVQRPAAQQPVTQQPAPQQVAAPPAPTPTVAPNTVPNAAQTAASVRDFLREESAGTVPTHQTHTNSAPLTQPNAPVAPAPEAPAAPAPETSAPAPEVPAAPAATEAPAPVPAAIQTDAPATSPANTGAQPAHDAAKPHPNEGAAGFGRPISDILSAAQIASIGNEPIKPAAAVATPATQPGAPVQQGMAPAPAPAPAPASAAQDGPAAAQGMTAAVGQPVGSADAADAGGELNEDVAGGFSDLLEVWPDLLEEILEQDRNAWNAVKSVQPLSLEGDLLAVGMASRSDLEAFKAAGAGPLREAILSAVGITVRYQPRPLQQGTAPATPAQPQDAGDATAEEPHRGPQQTGPVAPTENAANSAGSDALETRAAARLSALGPALAAPAWADPVPEAPAPASPQQVSSQQHSPQQVPAQLASPQPVAPQQAQSHTLAPQQAAAPPVPAPPVPAPEPTPVADDPYANDPYANDPYAGEPSDDSYDDPYGSGEGSGFAPAPMQRPIDPGPGGATSAPQAQAPQAPQAQAPQAPAPQAQTQAPAPRAQPPAPQGEAAEPLAPQAPEPQPSAAQEPAAPRASSPSFTRYGEAVVRETLGARFVEELPLGPSIPQN